MIIGIGIDHVAIDRFAHWKQYSYKQLCRVFSDEEIRYCLSQKGGREAQHFAVRFAAKEAFYKALMQSGIGTSLSLWQVCRLCSVYKSDIGVPDLMIAWQSIGVDPLLSLVSLSHTSSSALAMVMLQKSASNTKG